MTSPTVTSGQTVLIPASIKRFDANRWIIMYPADIVGSVAHNKAWRLRKPAEGRDYRFDEKSIPCTNHSDRSESQDWDRITDTQVPRKLLQNDNQIILKCTFPHLNTTAASTILLALLLVLLLQLQSLLVLLWFSGANTTWITQTGKNRKSKVHNKHS